MSGIVVLMERGYYLENAGKALDISTVCTVEVWDGDKRSITIRTPKYNPCPVCEGSGMGPEPEVSTEELEEELRAMGVKKIDGEWRISGE